MRRTITPLLAILASGVLSLTATAQETVAEPSSGVPFPTRLAAPAGDEMLMGTGIRTRTILKVKVYAFGLYVDPTGARDALAAFAGKDHKALSGDRSFYATLLERRFPMTLRLVMTRDVGGEDMAEAFDGALRPRVQRAATEMGLGGGEEALEQFRGYFSVEQVTKGTELLFICTPDGTLSPTVKGEPKPPINSAALCWALFDVYLGDKPISGDGRKSVIQNFPALLAPGEMD